MRNYYRIFGSNELIPRDAFSVLTEFLKEDNKISQNNFITSHWVAQRYLKFNHDRWFDWVWTSTFMADVLLEEEMTVVHFHPEFSSGTETIVGNKELKRGYNHFWEIEFLSPVYGTDMVAMIGICNSKFSPFDLRTVFRSALGDDSNSWGISYHGYTQHGGVKQKIIKNSYQARLGDGTKIGLHVDSWLGEVTLYVNGHSHGVIWRNIHTRGEPIYPAVSSTAARTKTKLLCSVSKEISLQYFACKNLARLYSISQLIEHHHKINIGYFNTN